MVPAPIHRLAPLITHSPFSSRAEVASPPAMSEPWSGSVSAKAPSWVKAVSPGSQRRFCSSEPSSSIMPTISSLWMPTRAESETSARATSTYMRPLKSLDVPSVCSPPSPRFPISASSPNGNSSRFQ